jgi:hypothetical protein
MLGGRRGDNNHFQGGTAMTLNFGLGFDPRAPLNKLFYGEFRAMAQHSTRACVHMCQ